MTIEIVFYFRYNCNSDIYSSNDYIIDSTDDLSDLFVLFVADVNPLLQHVNDGEGLHLPHQQLDVEHQR